MRILLIGINYAPEHAGIGPYTAEMAEDLQAHGHDVSVLTGMPHYPAWSVSQEYRGRIGSREHHGGVRVIRRAIYVPDRQSAVRRAAYEGSFLVTGFLPLRIARPDAIIGIVPSLSGAVLARLLAHKYATRYGLLFQDLMGPAAQQSGISGAGHVARLTAKAEQWAVRRASAVGAVSTSFLPYLRDLGAPEDRLLHVPNWTRVKAVPADGEARIRLRRSLGWADDDVVVMHSGNMGHKQNLGQVIDAACEAEKREGPTIRFVLVGEGNQRARLEAEAKDRHACRIQILPPQPEEGYMEILGSADVLLVTERASVSDMALPSKLTSYAVAGRPVLGAVNKDGATAVEIRRSGIGITVAPENAVALLEAVTTIARDRELSDRLAAAGPAYARRSLERDHALKQVSLLVDLVGAMATADDPARIAVG